MAKCDVVMQWPRSSRKRYTRPRFCSGEHSGEHETKTKVGENIAWTNGKVLLSIALVLSRIGYRNVTILICLMDVCVSSSAC